MAQSIPERSSTDSRCGRNYAPPWIWLSVSALGLALSACGAPFSALQEGPSENPGAAGSVGGSVGTAAIGAGGAPAFNSRGGAALGLAAGAGAAGESGAGVAEVAGAEAGGASGASSGGASGATNGGAGGAIGGGAGGATSGGAGVTATLDVIDDFEGAFPALPERAGRNGGWYVVHDDTDGNANLERATLLNPEASGNHYAVRMSGSGFTDWGAQLGASLNSSVTGYDASRYCGVRFMAKGAAATWTLMISDRQSVPQGGVCGAWDTEDCYQYVGKTFDIGSDWRAIEIGFGELSPIQNPDSARKLDVAAIYDIMFNFDSGDGRAFELWVDDVAFIEKAGPSCPLNK